MSSHKPTCDLRWVVVPHEGVTSFEPMARSRGNEWSSPEWFKLQQRWVSELREEPDEWRDIEVKWK